MRENKYISSEESGKDKSINKIISKLNVESNIGKS